MSLDELKRLDAIRAENDAIDAMAIKDENDPKPREPRARIDPFMPEAVYHADPCDKPSLTQSIAHTLVCESPALAYMQHPKLGNVRREATPDMEAGSAFHSLILGQGASVVVIEADSFRGAHAQDMAAMARNAGKIPLLASKFEGIKKAADAARTKIEALGYRFDGESEVSVFWDEATTWGEIVPCRARFDHLCAGHRRILDVKKCADANPNALPRHMTDFGYDIQEAAYRRALRALYPDVAGRDEFVFLCCEMSPPYHVTPADLAGSMRTLGEIKWQRAVDLWAKCLSTNTWPDYVTTTVHLEAPSWELSRWMAA